MDSKTKLKYDKAKYTVKKWEKEFKSLTSKTPTKADIKNAPSKIKDAYRLYYKLKTSVLETTLSSSVCLDENATDCFNSSNETQDMSFPKPSETASLNEDSICFQPLNDSTLMRNTLDDSHNFNCESICDESNSRLEKELRNNDCLNFKNMINQPVKPTEVIKSPERNGKENLVKKDDQILGVWGDHLNKKTAAPVSIKKLETKSLSMQYAQKLFNPDKFKNLNKKNPRKPRVFQKSKTFESILPADQPKFDIPKFEFFTNDDKGSPQVQLTETVPPESSLTELSSDMSTSNSNREFSEKEDASFNLFDEKLRIITKVGSSSGGSSAMSLLQKTYSEGEQQSSLGRTVDSAWLDRVQQVGCLKKTESMSQDSGIGSSQGAFKPDSSSDSEDLIYDSDSESQSVSRSALQLMKFTSNSALSSSVQTSSSVSNSFSGLGQLSTPFSSSLTSQRHNETSLSQMKTFFPKCEEKNSSVGQMPLSAPEVSLTENKKRSLDSGDLPASKKPKHDINTVTSSGTLPEIAAASKKRSTTRKKTPQNDPDVDKKLALLEKKLQSGKANENFVSINIQKKVFVRGKKTATFSKYKKQKWKQLKQENGSHIGHKGVLKCFKCGDVGHFSRACPSDKGLLPLEDYVSDDESAFPTLQEAADAAKDAGEDAHAGKRKFTQPTPAASEPIQAPLEMDKLGLLGSTIKPPYSLRNDGSVMKATQEVYDVLHSEFGHANFLEGQELAVMRILSGKSTLVTLSTGSGKSLCYQLPAAIYSLYNPGCITLIISPLVSLMEDQVGGAGGWEKSACYHTFMTQKKRDKILEQLKARELSALLISPETLVSLEAGAGKQLLSVLPPIAFACIDEVHCLHQWCHNFRPSYLTVTQVLRERFGVRTLLGLTATASSGTIESLMNHLCIDPNDKESLIKDTPLPENLILSVSVTNQDREKQEALITLLTSGCFAQCSSIIIYCTRRETCDKVAGYLRTSLQQQNGNNKKGRLSLDAEVYHAGLTAGRRNQVQKAFMSGKLRIVVATVAFGMGINKPDIRGVIHYSLPSTFENYVQEVGRAGRDRKPARCHLFLDSQNGDLGELRRHIYCDTIDRFVIRKLLQFVFVPCSCPEGTICPKHEVAFSIDTTVADLDLPQENVLTLLAYLELSEKKWIKTLPLAYTKCKVSSYRGPNHLKSVCKSCPPLAAAMVEAQANSDKAVATLEFDIFELARKINWDSGVLKKTLKNIEWTTENDKPKKSGIVVEFLSLGFRVLAPGNLPDEELDHALEVLNTTVQDHEKAKLKGLKAFYNALSTVSYENTDDFIDEDVVLRSSSLKENIRKYFTDHEAVKNIILDAVPLVNEGQIVDDIRQLIASAKGDHVLTGRAIARIFHGIGSPNFPPIVWGRTRFWRLHMNQDFNSLCKLATKQLLLFR